MKRIAQRNRGRRGYTIIEILIASAVLSLGAAAAASLAMTSTRQEDMNWRIALSLNWHESAATLYRLGHSPSEILDILPPNPDVQTHTITESATTIGALGSLPVATSQLVFRSDPNLAEDRTHQILTVRLTNE
ncbi:MAG: prepilin-type N-terminal cleavage/methylation domain-containing protein [Verrucomicrobiota bacterium]